MCNVNNGHFGIDCQNRCFHLCDVRAVAAKVSGKCDDLTGHGDDCCVFGRDLHSIILDVVVNAGQWNRVHLQWASTILSIKT